MWMLATGTRGQMGLKNLEGEQIVPPTFEWTQSGFSWACCSHGDQLSIVDSTGTVIRKVDGVRTYMSVSEGMLGVTDTSTKKDGYLSIESSSKDIPCIFEIGRDFSGGVASVKQYIAYQRTAWGLIDKQGKFLISPRYHEIGFFSDGVDVAPYSGMEKKRDGKEWGLINRVGDIIVPPSWSAIIEGFFEGYMVAQEPSDRGYKEDEGWGLVDTNGRWTLGPIWEGLGERVNEQSIGACVGGKWGVIDLLGNWIVEPRFDFCGAFYDGIARASMKTRDGDMKTGYIGKDGKWIIQPIYDSCDDFHHGLGRVYKTDEATDDYEGGFVDKNGGEYWKNR
jgi:hypothetical protein